MSQKSEIEAQIAELQAQLAILNGIPEDTFYFNTVVVFASSSGKWYYVKIGEELWRNLITGVEKDLASWVFDATQSNIGYFEAYALIAQPSPWYASS